MLLTLVGSIGFGINSTPVNRLPNPGDGSGLTLDLGPGFKLGTKEE